MDMEQKIKEWKAKYGDVFRIDIDGKTCYLKHPSRKALGYASIAGKNDPLKFNEVILNDCWLGGDEEIKTDDALFLGVAAKIGELIELKEATLVKL